MPFALQLPESDAAQLRTLKTSLDEWRRKGRKPRQISSHIWDGAIALAADHGVGLVSKNLKLDYGKLRTKLLQKSGSAELVGSSPKRSASTPATFVELLHSQGGTTLQPCIFQIESGHGPRMQVEVSGLDVSGLSTLIREFAG